MAPHKFIIFSKYYLEKESRFLFGVFILAFFLKVLHVILTYNTEGTSKWVDDWEYLSMGRQIAEGNWNPQTEILPYMQVGPVLPLLIALFIKLFTDPVIPVYLYNILITSLLCPLLYLIGKELFGKPTGSVIAVWALVNLDFFRYNPHLTKEATVFFLLPLTLYFLIKMYKGDEIRNLFWASVSYIFLIHTDERYLIYLPFLVLFILVKPAKLRMKFLHASLWIVFVFILMIPWGVRNLITFNQVVLISPRTTVFTSKLWGKNLTDFSFDKEKLANEKKYPGNSEQGSIINSPFKDSNLTIERLKAFVNFWQPFFFNPAFVQKKIKPQIWSLNHNLASIMLYGIFLPFYLAGMVFLIKTKHFRALLLAMIPIIHSLIHAYMIWPSERYRAPVNFIVVMTGIWVILEYLLKQPHKPQVKLK